MEITKEILQALQTPKHSNISWITGNYTSPKLALIFFVFLYLCTQEFHKAKAHKTMEKQPSYYLVSS